MRTTLFHFGLALVLLAQGPLCGLLCDFPILDAGVTVAVQQGPGGPSPCHEDPVDPAPSAPFGSHDDCAGCDILLLTAGESATAAAGIEMHAPAVAAFWPTSQALALGRVVRARPSGRPPAPDILLLNSTLLI